MFKKITFIFFILIIFFCAKNLQAANLKNAFTTGSNLDQAGAMAGYQPAIGLDPILQNIISIVLSFLGVIFLILIIYAGYLWMMARGNEQQVEKAKSLLTEAIIGLIIVVSAYAISYFVIKKIGDNTLQSRGSTPAAPAS